MLLIGIRLMKIPRKLEENKMNGVVHFEIPVDNVKRATDFYKKLFG